MSAATSRSNETSTRNSQLARIHVGAKQLGLSDDVYRDFLERVSGKRSAGDLDAAERARVLDEMDRLGFKRTAGKGPKRTSQPDSPQVRFCRGLWVEIKHLGGLHDPSERALQKFAKRITGVDNLSWMRPSDLNKVIQGLLAWRARLLARTE
jgi:phage gp16-like protein